MSVTHDPVVNPEPTNPESPNPESFNAESPNPEPADAEPAGHQPTSGQPSSGHSPAGRGLFRAFWRWHFYASFLVVPVLLLLAVTGLIYLFRFQLEPALHGDLMRVTRPTAESVGQPLEPQQAAVARDYPDATVVSVTEPRTDTDATRFTITLADESVRDVFVDPWTGRVLGDLDPDRTLSGYAVRLHGDLMTGKVGDAVIELGACWAIVMASTGLYLFWRGRIARARRRVAGAAGAALRSRHARTGLVVAGGLLFLVVSGLPWTGLWGEQVQRLATSGGSSLWSEDPGAESDPTSRLDESLPHSHDVPWAQGAQPVPTSGGGQDEKGGERPVASADTAVAVGARLGLAHPMTVILPETEQGVFSVLGYSFNDPGDERTVHVDRFGGVPVSQYAYDDYPVLAKTVAQGIALHEGRRFGTTNLVITTVFCLAVIFMCVTGPTMWWRRRPAGRTVGAPRGRLPLRATPVLAVGVVALGVLLPLFGASLAVVLLLDRFVLRRLPATRRWFDVAT
jgi:uncharacterized iron-regulated membrane protein